ncbi:MAG: hypothetical protein IKS51_09825 [Erysipelotrichaceae bacterium]|nr:hypothetical protein [Erysipelotrichaceae bacterium]
MKKSNDTTGNKKTRGIFLLAGCILFVVAVLLVILGGRNMSLTDLVSGKKIVGKDILSDDITEFYYTYDASTYPPDYQRYRFYAEDGRYYFYHEKREGDHWPLREEDITVSGTKELTQEEWNHFFESLCGGIVQNRDDDVVDGDAGPWLYLYWKNDRGKLQEFSFASWEEEKDFEQYCLELMGNQ